MVIGAGGVIFCNTAKTPIGNTCTVVVSNNAYMDSWDNFANSGITLPNNFTIGAGGGQLWNTRSMYFGHACYNTYSGAFTLNGNLIVVDKSTYSGAPANTLTLGQMNFTGPISGPGGIYSYRVPTTARSRCSGASTYTGPTVVTNNSLVQLSSIQQGDESAHYARL